MSEKLPIDGPAGRQEVNKSYRDNYDDIFRPEKSNKKDGGKKNDRKSP